ncbi:hypothetical protein FB451DRAFT_1385956 [Mycena latifolia]|nr:hypothetical protein FB451DRAFT_1385956 [Mycena latifolia]
MHPQARRRAPSSSTPSTASPRPNARPPMGPFPRTHSSTVREGVQLRNAAMADDGSAEDPRVAREQGRPADELVVFGGRELRDFLGGDGRATGVMRSALVRSYLAIVSAGWRRVDHDKRRTYWAASMPRGPSGESPIPAISAHPAPTSKPRSVDVNSASARNQRPRFTPPHARADEKHVFPRDWDQRTLDLDSHELLAVPLVAYRDVPYIYAGSSSHSWPAHDDHKNVRASARLPASLMPRMGLEVVDPLDEDGLELHRRLNLARRGQPDDVHLAAAVLLSKTLPSAPIDALPSSSIDAIEPGKLKWHAAGSFPW